MKKIFYLLFATLGIFSACTDDEGGSLDVYTLENVTVDFKVTAMPKDTVVAGTTYNMSTWKVEATVLNAVPYRYSAQLSYPSAIGVSGTGLNQIISYAKPGEYTISVTVNSNAGANGGVKTFEYVINQDFTTGLPMTDDDIAYAQRVLCGKTWVLDTAVKGHLANTWWEAAPNEKATSRCYDDEFTFNNDFSFICKTNGDAYGNPGGKSALSRFAALTFDGDESQYDMFIKVDESKRAPYTFQVKKRRDYKDADPTKDTQSYYIKLSSDEAYLGYWDEMVNSSEGRWFQIINEDGDDNNITVRSWGYKGDGTQDFFRQTKLVVKGYVPVVIKKPDGIYNMKETFEGDFLADYNYGKNPELIYDENGSKYLYNPNDGTSSIVADPAGTTNQVVKINRPAADKAGHLYSPTLPMPLVDAKGLVVSVKVYIPATNHYVYNGDRESWSWDPTGQPESEFANLRVRLENPDLGSDAWTTRVEKEVNLFNYKDEWVTVVFHMTKTLQDMVASKNEKNYKTVGLMFGREGYAHTESLDIYYDDILITTPDVYNEVTILKSASNKVVHVY